MEKELGLSMASEKSNVKSCYTKWSGTKFLGTSRPGMDLNSQDENNAKNGDKNIRFLIGFLEVTIMFWDWINALKKKY